MANMSLVKNPMPSQDPNVRNKNFDEVALGYTPEQAIDEAQKQCKLYINGTDLDPFNEVQVNDIIAKMKKERVY